MIVAGQAENLESTFNASELMKFVKASDVSWQSISGTGTSGPLVLKTNGNTSAGCLILANNRERNVLHG